MKINNPVLRGFNPDPSICRVGDDYYIAVSTFEWFPGVQIHHSKDLVHWELVSQPLNRLSQLNMLGDPDSGGVWAPCLSYADNHFWLIYSDVKVVEGDCFKDVTNYLVTCDTIDGTWSEPIVMNTSGFDPSLFHDEDGRKYFVNMVWDYRPQNHRFYGIVLQEYSVEERKLIGPKKIIYKGTGLGLTEAPHLYKVGAYYYLLVAEGGTKFEHAACIARAKSITGPYEDHPHNPILTAWDDLRNPLQKAGHASLVQTQDGQWYLAHLLGRPLKLPKDKLLENRGFCPLGRETGIQKIEWHDEWPFVVGGPHPSEHVDAPDLPAVSFAQDYPVQDEFTSATLNHHFQTLRVPFTEQMGSLSARPGYLRLFGAESPHSTFRQSLVARRWQSFNFTAETFLDFKPETFLQFAGLICYYNIRNWTSLHVTEDEEKGKIITILNCDHFQTSAPLAGEEIQVPRDLPGVYLRVEVAGLSYHFEYSFDGVTYQQVGPDWPSWKLSDDYVDQGGFFTGAFVGMHCVDLSGEKIPADFDYFKYEEHD